MESLEYRPQFLGFRDLMQYRVREILLVSTPYDAFVLEEDGQLSEKLFGEYLDLNLQFVPRIDRVSSAEEAFAALQQKTYDLVITMPRISDMNPFDFGKQVKETYPGKTVVMLTYDSISQEMAERIRNEKAIDRIFHWSGNSRILLAIVKYVEDLGNLEFDSGLGVQIILVVDDSPLFYSRFLPVIYTEVMKQTRYLLSHAVNDLHRLLRMRARPKILLAETYEEAVAVMDRYRNNLLGVISDSGFPREGKLDPLAGLQLAVKAKQDIPDLPFLLQSEEAGNERQAAEAGISFLPKNRPDLFAELRKYMLNNYGFGEFIFKYPDGRVIARAADIADFEKVIFDLPEESLLYHAGHNHFSRWFRARTEFEVASQLRYQDVANFSGATAIRKYILDCMHDFFKRYQKEVILDFGASKMDLENSFIKLGNGSLGGKSRGVAFFNSLLAKSDLPQKYPDLKFKTPRSFTICSDVFEEFVEGNDLHEFAIGCEDQAEIVRRFLETPLPAEIIANLRRLIATADYPFAVRPSSSLEDSQTLPFAGIYKTYFLPNQHPDGEIRLQQLLDAVRMVYASVFFKGPKQYIKNAGLRIEEEKMAVLIQEAVGERHGDIFYPVISGVAQSYNFYTYSHMRPEDGSVSLALGFGKTIVEGGQIYRFSPAYPEMNPPYSSPEEFMKKTQDYFYALHYGASPIRMAADAQCAFEKLDIEQAERDGTLALVASAYSREDDLITDSLSVQGPRIVTFAPVLKYGLLPLPAVIRDLFQMGKWAFGSDVEIEFAVNIPIDKRKKPEFYFLQIRPMLTGQEGFEAISERARERCAEADPRANAICGSSHTIGNGIFRELYDLIFVDPDTFHRSETNRIAHEIGELNQQLQEEGRKCVLLGFGRMGTADSWLGIPLSWSQMSQAKVVIEADWGNFQADPSLGSHFYHNLTSLKMGYFHIGLPYDDQEYINWDWLKGVPVFRQTGHVKHLRFEQPILAVIEGHHSTGIILKPGCLER